MAEFRAEGAPDGEHRHENGRCNDLQSKTIRPAFDAILDQN